MFVWSHNMMINKLVKENIYELMNEKCDCNTQIRKNYEPALIPQIVYFKSWVVFINILQFLSNTKKNFKNTRRVLHEENVLQLFKSLTYSFK